MNDPADSQRSHIRHHWADRLFHWGMAISVIVLGATAFLPILGVKFDWVPIHWISGVILGIVIVYHLCRVFAVHGLGEMMPARSDLTMIRREVLFQDIPDEPSGKFDVFQKSYHWAASIVVLTLAITADTGITRLEIEIQINSLRIGDRIKLADYDPIKRELIHLDLAATTP